MTATIDVYNRKAADYADIADNAPAGMAEFLAALPDAARVLDLGCGPGHHAALIAKAGHKVLAVDGSREMVALAAKQDGVEAQLLMFDDIASLDTVDGIWASFSLLHAARSDLSRHLSALHRICASKAPVCLGMKLGTGEATDAIGRFYSYYSEAELRQHLTDAGFTPGKAQTGEGRGLAGTIDRWIVIHAHA